MNVPYEADPAAHIAAEPEVVLTPSASGRGPRTARCSVCKVAVCGNDGGAGPAVCLVRVGTMDDPDQWPPDIHIFTSSKQPLVTLQPGARAVAAFCDLNEVWPDEAKARRRIMRERAQTDEP